MTAPDPGLTDLIATHTFESGGGGDGYHEPFSFGAYCSCGEEYGSWVQVAGDDGLDYPDIDLLANLHAAHVALVVAQHNNGRIAELGWGELVAAIPDGWELQESAQLEEVSRVRQRGLEASQATTARWRARAEKAEATIARVITALEAAEKSVPDDWGVTYIYTSQLRAALEGEQQ
ncbi:hypothetical protein [Rhodococcus qingshengii]|uniref:hypothetical protein n=1 Tax=Rhodococcus qingshengii TaxID=334542 RepID=UPI003018A09D